MSVELHPFSLIQYKKDPYIINSLLFHVLNAWFRNYCITIDTLL